MPTNPPRASLIRLASTLPKGSPERKSILNIITAGEYPNPQDDLDGFVEAFEKDLMLPYPAIYNALGVDRNDLHLRTKIHGDTNASLQIKGPKGTDLVIDIDASGSFVVSGKINGEKIPVKMFKFRPGYPGLHRGSRGEIVSYIEDSVPSLNYEYVVSTVNGTKVYKDKESLTRDYPQVGAQGPGHVMQGLVGQPKLRGLIGPMWDGHKGGVGRVRYMDQQTYDRMSI